MIENKVGKSRQTINSTLQQGFALIEVSLVLLILAVGMLSIERWQHQAIIQTYGFSQQLASWILAAEIIDKLANNEIVQPENSAGFRIDYTIRQQLGCRLFSVQVEGQYQSKAQLRFFDCPTKSSRAYPDS